MLKKNEINYYVIDMLVSKSIPLLFYYYHKILLFHILWLL